MWSAMNSQFICFVVISGNKFDLVINNPRVTRREATLTYTDIHPKICKILEIALRKEFDVNNSVIEVCRV